MRAVEACRVVPAVHDEQGDRLSVTVPASSACTSRSELDGCMRTTFLGEFCDPVLDFGAGAVTEPPVWYRWRSTLRSSRRSEPGCGGRDRWCWQGRGVPPRSGNASRPGSGKTAEPAPPMSGIPGGLLRSFCPPTGGDMGGSLAYLDVNESRNPASEPNAPTTRGTIRPSRLRSSA